MKLLGKIIFKGKFITKTGLHIGGSKSSLAIGGIDNNVIKTANGLPYIPGSSIKGKLRSLLAKVEGSLFFNKNSKNKENTAISRQISKATKNKEELEQYQSVIKDAKTDEDISYMMDLFGYSGDNDVPRISHTHLLVRDAFLENPTDAVFREGYTDSKWENVINRRTGTAEHPRQMERVPVGAAFGFEIVYNVYKENKENKEAINAKVQEHLSRLLLALDLLQDDGLGGQISRGYGQVKVQVEDVKYKMIDFENFTYDSMTMVPQNVQPLLDKFSTTFSAE